MKFLSIIILFICSLAYGQVPSVNANAGWVNPGALTDSQFNTIFSSLNLQSDNAANFSLTSTSVNQWNDLSSSANHATGTSTSRPTYSASDVSFDGTNDFLQLGTEINLTGNFSIYIVYKKNALSNNKVLFGTSSAPDNYYQLNTNNTITVQHAGSSEGALIATQGQMTTYVVLSIRRQGNTYVMQANDRKLYFNSNLLVGTPATRIGLIGKRIAGASIDGHIKAFCVSSSYIDDSVDKRVKAYLYSKYNIPAEVALVGFGDSITFQNTWLDLLGTSLGLPTVNQGVSGSLLTNNNPGNAQLSMRNRVGIYVISRYYLDKITILGGTNDILDFVTASAYAADLREIIQILLSYGYNPRNICVGSTPYQTSGANASTLDLYRTQIVSICSEYNVRYADILQAMRDNGGDALMADGLHPNASGGVVIKDTFAAAFTGP